MASDYEEREEEKRFEVFSIQLDHKAYLVVALLLALSCAVVIFYRKNLLLIHNIPERCIMLIFCTVFTIIAYTCTGSDKPMIAVNFHEYILYIFPWFIFHTAWSLPKKVKQLRAGKQKDLPLSAVVLFCCLVPVLSALVNSSLVYLILGYQGVTYLKALVTALIYVPVDLPPQQLASLFSDWEFGDVVYLLHAGETLSSYLQSTLLLNLATTLAINEDLRMNAPEKVEGSVWEMKYVFSRWIISVVISVASGFTCGLLSEQYTKLYKITYHSVPVVEPIMIICLFYLSFIVAQMFGFGGPLAATICALYMAVYTEPRTSKRSRHVIRGCLRMTSSIADWFACLSLVQHVCYHKSGFDSFVFNSIGNWSFAVSIFIFCFATRIVLTYTLCSCFNLWFGRKDRKTNEKLVIIKNWEKFSVFYSGFRGPLSLWLAIYVEDCFRYPLFNSKLREGIATAVLIAILITTFVQGPTLKTLSKCLLGTQRKSPRQKLRRKKYLSVASDAIVEPIRTGIESIAREKKYICRSLRLHKIADIEKSREKRAKLFMMTEQYELGRKLKMMLIVDSVQSYTEKASFIDYDPLGSVGSSLISLNPLDPDEEKENEYECRRRKKNPFAED